MKKYTTYQKALTIRAFLLMHAGCALNKMDCTPEQRIESLSFIYRQLESLEYDKGSFKIDPNDLNTREQEKLGFNFWDNIMTIPVWLCPFLADEFEAISIKGSEGQIAKILKRSEIDIDDVCFFCISWGVKYKMDFWGIYREIQFRCHKVLKYLKFYKNR